MNGDQVYFHRAIRKYGVDNFIWETLETYDLSREKLKVMLNEREIYYIAKYNSNNSKFGYNLTCGGDSQQEQAINFWSSDKGIVERQRRSEMFTAFWSDINNKNSQKEKMLAYFQSPIGKATANRHKSFMQNYYNGDNARKNKAKTSKWFVEATTPDGEILYFISSKEPNLYFKRDIGLRCFLKVIGDIWEPSEHSKLFGWVFKAIEKDEKIFNY